MGRYVTPAGVEIEMGDEAAAAIGFKPADDKPKAKPAARKGEDKK